MRRLALTLLAVAGGVVLAIGPASPAHAHATLESSVPAGSSVLDTAPTDIILDFDESVTAEAGGIRLIDASGAEIALGQPEQGDDATILITPVPEIPDGAYVVAWQVVSQDGHPAAGAFTFQVGRGEVVDTRDLLASVLSGQAGDEAVGQLGTFTRLLTYVGIALGLGGAVFVVAIWPSASTRWSARRLVWFGWGLLLIGTIGTLLISGPYLTGRALDSALDPDVLRSVADARVIQMAAVRLVLVLLALPLLLRLGRGLSANAQLFGVVLGELVLGTMALAGHSGSGRWSAAGVVLDATHLGAMAVWLGGLALLVVMLVVTPTPVAPDEVLEDGSEPAVARELAGGTVGAAAAPVDDRVEAVERFSSVGFVCVVALVVTGVAQTWRVLPGGLDDLTGTEYGRTLLVKLAFVAVLVGLGWFSRRLVRRRRFGQPLWRSVATEVVVAVVVLAVTAVLTGTSPAQATAQSRTVTATMVQGDLLADVSVIPARVGPNDLHLTFSPPGGTLNAIKEATARITLPSRTDIGAIPVELVPAGPNHYIASGVQVPFGGDWTLEVVATTAEDATVRLSTTVNIAE